MIMRNGYEAARPPEERSRLGGELVPGGRVVEPLLSADPTIWPGRCSTAD